MPDAGICTPEALKRIARGAKQPRVRVTQGVTNPGRGCRLPDLRTPPGCGFHFDTPFPGCVLRTTRGYRLQRLRRTDWQLVTGNFSDSLLTSTATAGPDAVRGHRS
jgi:hypothetical protein